MQLSYAIHMQEETEGGVTITFPDIAGSSIHGKNEKQALKKAQEYLTEVLADSIHDGEELPKPNTVGDIKISPSIDIALKAIIHSTMLERGLSKSALARRMRVDGRAVQRLISPNHSNSIDSVCRALEVLELNPSISF